MGAALSQLGLQKRCQHCKRTVPALKVGDRIIVLPHSPTGGKPKWGENCGQGK